MKNQLVIPIAIVVAGIVLAFAVYSTLAPAGLPGLKSAENPSAMRPIHTSDHMLGNPAAKVIIVLYSDFDCPHCQSFDTVLRQIISDYGTGGDVAWVFRNFALTENHPNARMHAIAAECVALSGGNKAYWEFAKLLFDNQPASPTKYAEYAKAAGASPESVATCIQNAETNGVGARVDEDRENALAIGAQGTPFSLIVTAGSLPVTVSGAWSYADIKDKLDAALAKAK